MAGTYAYWSCASSSLLCGLRRDDHCLSIVQEVVYSPISSLILHLLESLKSSWLSASIVVYTIHTQVYDGYLPSSSESALEMYCLMLL